MSNAVPGGTATGRRRPRAWLRRAAALTAATLLALSQGAPALASPASLQQQEWWIGRLGLRQAWQVTRGAGVTVAVIDSGLNPSIGDLRGAVVPGFNATGGGNGETETDNPRGHGTSMAVDIAGRGLGPGILGIAPAAKVMPVILDINSTDGSHEAAVLTRLAGLPHPPQIVNMSFGTPGACPPPLQRAVRVAVDKGLILVASAGNEGSTTNASQFPANCAGVVAVGAYDFDGHAWNDTQRQPYVSLGGPGVDIVAYNRALTTGTASGTSDAAAFVSGEFALLRAHFPTMPARQLVARMFATASTHLYRGPHYGRPGDTLGFGPALVHKALTQQVPAGAPNPVYDALAAVAPPSDRATPARPGDASGAVPAAPREASHAAATSSAGSPALLIGGIAAAVVALAALGWWLSRRRRPGPGHPPPPVR